MKSIYAGMLIGLGGLIYLSCPNKIIGSFLFSIGLISILVFELNLYTGKVCYLNNYKKFGSMIWVLLGNLCGTEVINCITYVAKQSIIKDSVEITLLKLAKDIPTILIDGVICGLCIAVAVKGYNKAEGIGKYLLVVLGVMVFILAGSEHVVANMYYMGNALSKLDHSYVWPVIRFILFNALGNTIGGLLFSGIDMLSGGIKNGEK